MTETATTESYLFRVLFVRLFLLLRGQLDKTQKPGHLGPGYRPQAPDHR